jgi:hypothetical protein
VSTRYGRGKRETHQNSPCKIKIVSNRNLKSFGMQFGVFRRYPDFAGNSGMFKRDKKR